MARIRADAWYEKNKSRATVDRDTFLLRVELGMTAEKALGMPITPEATDEWYEENKDRAMVDCGTYLERVDQGWSNERALTRRMTHEEAGQWYEANQDRARVDLSAFLRRISMGWNCERALETATTGGRYTGPMSRQTLTDAVGGRGQSGAHLYRAFGISRTLEEWHQATGVLPDHIYKRVKREHGGSMQKFLHSIGWYPGKTRYFDDGELDTDTDEAVTWVPGRRTAKKVAASPKTFRRINLDDVEEIL